MWSGSTETVFYIHTKTPKEFRPIARRNHAGYPDVNDVVVVGGEEGAGGLIIVRNVFPQVRDIEGFLPTNVFKEPPKLLITFAAFIIQEGSIPPYTEDFHSFRDLILFNGIV